MDVKDPASTLIWIRDKKDVWRIAKIVSATEKEVVVEGKDGGEETFSGADHAIWDTTHNIPMSDLSQYNNLHEAPLLYGLKKRFADDTIYTHCGDILGK
jgi:myosin heavy subunit